MAIKVKNTIKKPAATKSSRIVRAAATGKFTEAVVVSGPVANGKKITFRFSVVTPRTQARERNKAYQYFSID